MKISILAICRLGVLAAAAILAGCGSGPSQPAFGPAGTVKNAARPGENPLSLGRLFSLTTRLGIVPTVYPNHQRSWMAPDAKKKNLLYVSNYYGTTTGHSTVEVDVYHYNPDLTPPKKLLGKLTGFGYPYGECTDKAGDVFVVDWAKADIVEYAHGGASPIATLNDPGYFPIGCSVDPTTGNLAVANFGAVSSSSPGNVAIYQNASGSPTLYTYQSPAYYLPPGYDNKGNLFVEIQTATGQKNLLAELPSGSSTFRTISLSGWTINFPAGIMWDGSYLAGSDQEYKNPNVVDTGIYRIQISGSTGTVVSSIRLNDRCASSGNNILAVQPWIQKNRVVAGNLYNSCLYSYGYWNYANGGFPIKQIPSSIAPEQGWGQTVSKGQ